MNICSFMHVGMWQGSTDPRGAMALPPGVVRGGPARAEDEALGGRLVEISGTLAHAPWSYAAAMVVWGQRRDEICAWVQAERSELYPPDLQAAGIDLGRLLVARVPAAAGPFGPARAAEILLASGALGVLVLDFLALSPPAGAAWQSRLLARARAVGALVLVLTEKAAAAPSVGAMCGWRMEPSRRLTAAGHFVLSPRWLRHRSCAGWPEVGLRALAPWERQEKAWEATPPSRPTPP